MKKNTHRWQSKTCLFLMLVTMGTGSYALPNPTNGNTIVKPVEWPITGKVIDRTGNALPGVTVVVKGTTNGTATGVDGGFSLNVPENAGVLVFSFIGYTSQEKAFSGPATINVTMAEDAKALEEV